MTISRRELRGITLGLALLMAVPWQVALSAMERSTRAITLGSQVRLDEASHHLQWTGDESGRAPLDGLSLAWMLSAVEQEEDDNWTVGIDLFASPAHGCSHSLEPMAVLSILKGARSSFLLAQRFCLRC